MQTLTEKLIEEGLKDRIFSERQLERSLGSSPRSRYGLVNRALKAGELVRIRRGLYVLPPRFRSHAVHPFGVAQAIAPGSYVSFETALSHHGWIPESVQVTASVIPGRKSMELEHPLLGSFAFHPLALNALHFLELVERRQFASQTTLVAQPFRALMDLIALRKIEWTGLEWLVESLRIDLPNLRSVSRSDIQILLRVYKHRRVLTFLAQFARAVRR